MYNNYGVFMVTLPCHKVNTVRTVYFMTPIFYAVYLNARLCLLNGVIGMLVLLYSLRIILSFYMWTNFIEIRLKLVFEGNI